MRDYYRIDISECSVQGDNIELLNTVQQTQPTIDGVRSWLRDRYEGIPDLVQDDNAGYDQDILVYRFNNADWSHYPVEHWQQVDYVHVAHVHETDLDVDLFSPTIAQVTA